MIHFYTSFGNIRFSFHPTKLSSAIPHAPSRALNIFLQFFSPWIIINALFSMVTLSLIGRSAKKIGSKAEKLRQISMNIQLPRQHNHFRSERHVNEIIGGASSFSLFYDHTPSLSHIEKLLPGHGLHSLKICHDIIYASLRGNIFRGQTISRGQNKIPPSF